MERVQLFRNSIAVILSTALVLSAYACREVIIPNVSSVTILSPRDGDTVTVGDTVTFSAVAHDVYGNDVSHQVESWRWHRPLDGVDIGTKQVFTTDSLAAGIQLFTLTVTDWTGVPKSVTSTLTVGIPPCPVIATFDGDSAMSDFGGRARGWWHGDDAFARIRKVTQANGNGGALEVLMSGNNGAGLGGWSGGGLVLGLQRDDAPADVSRCEAIEFSVRIGTNVSRLAAEPDTTNPEVVDLDSTRVKFEDGDGDSKTEKELYLVNYGFTQSDQFQTVRIALADFQPHSSQPQDAVDFWRVERFLTVTVHDSATGGGNGPLLIDNIRFIDDPDVNKAPTVVISGDVPDVVDEGDPVVLDGLVSDSDNDELMTEWWSHRDSMALGNTIPLSVSTLEPGRHWISLRANDGAVAASDGRWITVKPVCPVVATFDEAVLRSDLGGTVGRWSLGDNINVDLTKTVVPMFIAVESHAARAWDVPDSTGVAMMTLSGNNGMGPGGWSGGGLTLGLLPFDAPMDWTRCTALEMSVRLIDGDLDSTRVKLEDVDWRTKDEPERYLSDYVSTLSSDWQTIRIALADFQPHGGDPSAWDTLDLSRIVRVATVTVHDSATSGGDGTLQLDDVRLVNDPMINLAPSVAFATPPPFSITEGDTLMVLGSALDPEDGTLDGLSLEWFSHRDGLLGTGTTLSTVSLSLGKHLLSIRATDSHGISASSSRWLSVLPACIGLGRFDAGLLQSELGGGVESWAEGTDIAVAASLVSPGAASSAGAAAVTITGNTGVGGMGWSGGGLVLHMQPENAPINVEPCAALEFSVRVQTGDLDSTLVKLEDSDPGNEPERYIVNYGVTPSSAWQTVRIPIADFQPQPSETDRDPLNLRDVTQFVTVTVRDAAVSGGDGQLQIDNVRLLAESVVNAPEGRPNLGHPLPDIGTRVGISVVTRLWESHSLGTDGIGHGLADETVEIAGGRRTHHPQPLYSSATGEAKQKCRRKKQMNGRRNERVHLPRWWINSDRR